MKSINQPNTTGVRTPLKKMIGGPKGVGSLEEVANTENATFATGVGAGIADCGCQLVAKPDTRFSAANLTSGEEGAQKEGG